MQVDENIFKASFDIIEYSEQKLKEVAEEITLAEAEIAENNNDMADFEKKERIPFAKRLSTKYGFLVLVTTFLLFYRKIDYI